MMKRMKRKKKVNLKELYFIYFSLAVFIIATLTSLLDDWKILALLQGGVLSNIILLVFLGVFGLTLFYTFKLIFAVKGKEKFVANPYIGSLFAILFLLFVTFYEYFSLTQLILAVSIELRSPEAIALSSFLFSFQGILFIIYWAFSSILLLLLSLKHLGYLRKKF